MKTILLPLVAIFGLVVAFAISVQSKGVERYLVKAIWPTKMSKKHKSQNQKRYTISLSSSPPTAQSESEGRSPPTSLSAFFLNNNNNKKQHLNYTSFFFPVSILFFFFFTRQYKGKSSISPWWGERMNEMTKWFQCFLCREHCTFWVVSWHGKATMPNIC